MKRSGFTMIELIFVIVILGILASVAIPKLAATRDDAKISKALNELATLQNDISSYYTSQGTFTVATNKITDMTNVPLYTNTACTTKATGINANGRTRYYYCTQKSGSSGLEPVVYFTANNTGGVLTFATSTGSGNIASAVKSSDYVSKLTATPKNLGGSRVKY